MRRRDFLKIGVAAAAGGYVLTRIPLGAKASGLVDLGDVTLVRGTMRLPGRTVPPGQTLRFDPDRNVTLELGGNLVVEGTLEMRPNPGFTHTLRFVGIKESNFVGGGMDVLDSDVGLWVIGTGKLDLQGQPRTGWNRTGTDPTWRRTDEILTTPFARGDYTSFVPYRGSAGSSRAGLATVTGPDGQVFTQEAFNLTRSVRIEGTRQGRSHIFIMSSAPQSIRYAAIRYVGPRKVKSDPQRPSASVLGRYGLHFHMCDEGSRGSEVVGTVVRDCGSHAFVPHMSNGVAFTDCIAYGVNEDAYWWDPGTTTRDTSWNHCLAAKLVPIPSFEGYRMGGFNLGLGSGNSVIDCVAVGNLGNGQAAGFIWPESGSGVWTFQRAVSHNNKRDGLFAWNNSASPHAIEDFVAFRNGYGIEHGSYRNVFAYERCMTFENGFGMRVWATSVNTTYGPMRWMDSNFDDGVQIVKHSLPSLNAAVIVDSPCSKVVVAEINSRAGGSYDFIRTGLEPSDWTVSSMHPSSVYRAQRADGSAYRVNADGTTTSIPAFA